MRQVSRLIIHSAASPNGRRLGVRGLSAAQVIDDWHRARGFKRNWRARAEFNPGLESIGYHWVIDTDGTTTSGRHPDEIGSHAAGHNIDSLGVCLAGTDEFTPAQWVALRGLVETQRRTWPNLQAMGHRDLPDVKKICPGFDVYAWDSGAREPVHGHICQEVAP